MFKCSGAGELLQVEPDRLLVGEPGVRGGDLDGRLLRRGTRLRAGPRRLPRRRRPQHLQPHGQSFNVESGRFSILSGRLCHKVV